VNTFHLRYKNQPPNKTIPLRCGSQNTWIYYVGIKPQISRSGVHRSQVARSPWRLNLVLRRLIFVIPQFWTCFVSPFHRHPKFLSWHPEFLENVYTPEINDHNTPPDICDSSVLNLLRVTLSPTPKMFKLAPTFLENVYTPEINDHKTLHRTLYVAARTSKYA
jgi:hypothetical protein